MVGPVAATASRGRTWAGGCVRSVKAAEGTSGRYTGSGDLATTGGGGGGGATGDIGTGPARAAGAAAAAAAASAGDCGRASFSPSFTAGAATAVFCAGDCGGTGDRGGLSAVAPAAPASLANAGDAGLDTAVTGFAPSLRRASACSSTTACSVLTFSLRDPIARRQSLSAQLSCVRD